MGINCFSFLDKARFENSTCRSVFIIINFVGSMEKFIKHSFIDPVALESNCVGQGCIRLYDSHVIKHDDEEIEVKPH